MEKWSVCAGGMIFMGNRSPLCANLSGYAQTRYQLIYLSTFGEHNTNRITKRKKKYFGSPGQDTETAPSPPQ